MKIIIRADASEKIGSGHIMRCLTLAIALSKRGADVSFVCRLHPGNLCDYIETKGFTVYRLPPPKEFSDQSGDIYAQWLGVDQNIDAQETIECINKQHPYQWMIVDHYSLQKQWEIQMRPYTQKIMVIDDLANRPHDCDLLLDQNICKNADIRYAGLISDDCIQLLGPRYALLRDEFVMNSKRQEDNNRVRRIQVFFGGSDPTDETSKTIRALSSINPKGVEVDVIVGASNKQREQIKRSCAERGFNFHCQIENMAALMRQADIAVGAGGSITWERAKMGLPCIVIGIAENQREIIINAAEMGFIDYLGNWDKVSAEKIQYCIEKYIKHPTKLKEMRDKGRKLVDGLGTERILEIMGFPKYRVSVISDRGSWINSYIPALIERLNSRNCQVNWVHDVKQIQKGDFAFLLSFSRIVPRSVLSLNRHNIVVHESALPLGRGWSPLTWQIIEGKNRIPITLFEAEEELDSGTIYLQDEIVLDGTELVDELRRAQAEKTLEMCEEFISKYPEVINTSKEQTGISTTYPRRRQQDSQLDPDKTIREQFNLLRVVDNDKYPAYFMIDGKKYTIKIYSSGSEKID